MNKKEIQQFFLCASFGCVVEMRGIINRYRNEDGKYGNKILFRLPEIGFEYFFANFFIVIAELIDST